ncbi:MAG: helix-turn-helix domain-containing protein [Candidatus Izemoplasmataceae bacterium]
MDASRFYETFRFKVKLRRLELSLTIRDLAKKTGLSHSTITRIEQGLIEPNDEMVLSLKKALAISFEACETCLNDFDQQYHQVIEDIMYVRYEPTHPTIEAMIKEYHLYEDCVCFYKFYLMLFMYTQHLRQYKALEDDLFNKLQILEPLFKDSDYELLLIQFGGYYINKGQRKKALEYLSKHLNLSTDKHLFAFSHNIKAIIHSEHYLEYKLALNSLAIASEIFQEVNNFPRLMQTKIFTQRIYIYMNRFDDFLKLYNHTNRYAQIKGTPFILERSKQNLARYYLATKQYQEALDILNSYKSDLGEYYAFKIYALFQLKYGVEAMHLIQKAKTDMYDDRYGQYKLCMLAIEHALTLGRDEGYLTKLKNFADSTLDRGDFMFAKMAIKLYTEALEDKRLYKEAYTYADKLLQAMRAIIK